MHLVWSVLKHAMLRVGYICVQMSNHIHSSVNAESALVVVKKFQHKDLITKFQQKAQNTLCRWVNTPLDIITKPKQHMSSFSLSLG
jgi:formylmethanofuran dehydrogenase subunit E-like metal-binding protein